MEQSRSPVGSWLWSWGRCWCGLLVARRVAASSARLVLKNKYGPLKVLWTKALSRLIARVM